MVNTIKTTKNVALFGAGGIGKTSIALAALHHPDIVLEFGKNRRFVPCDELGGDVTHDSLLELIAKYVGLKLRGNNRQGFLIRFLSMHPLLLALDNAETMLDHPQCYDATASFITTLASTENISLIVTSRSTAVPVEVPWHRIDVQVLNGDAAKRIFLSFHPVDDCDEVDKLLGYLGYHPLSIKLIAQVGAERRLSAPELLNRWMMYQTKILDPPNGGRLRSLRFSLEASLSSPSLSQLPGARDVLSILAFLPQGIDESKCRELFPSIEEIDLIMDSLCRVSLIEKRRDRVTLLPPIRSFIQESVPLMQKLLDDIWEFYSNILAMLWDSFPGHETFHMGRRFLHEEDINCETIIIHFIGKQHPASFVAGASFLHLLDIHAHCRQTKLAHVIRHLHGEEHNETYIHCLCFVGWLEFQMANYQDAEQILLHSHRLFTDIGSVSGEATCATSLGYIHLFLSNYEKAEMFLLQAGSLYTAKSYGSFCCDRILASVYRLQGKLSKARILAEETLSYFKSELFFTNWAWCLLQLGEIEQSSGNSSAAKLALTQARDEAVRLDDHTLIEKCDRMLASIEIDAGCYHQARILLEGARKLAIQCNDAHDAALCDAGLGKVEEGLLHYEEAKTLYQKARDEISRIGSKYDTADCACFLGGVEKKLGNLEVAVKWLVLAGEEFIRIKVFHRALSCAESIRSLGDEMLMGKDYREAKQVFIEARELYLQIGNADDGQCHGVTECEERLDHIEVKLGTL